MKIALFGRHPSPAEHIVFPEDGVNFVRKTNAKGQQRANTIPDGKMSDYNWMRSMCQAWLYEHWEPHMELYVEGFTPMTIAFIREWDDMQHTARVKQYVEDTGAYLTLILQHYQPTTGEYHPQVWRA
tara:strand:+ start:1491 stop:1871 length:381 start_codon:yes stop_codon:yes gene_type:complete